MKYNNNFCWLTFFFFLRRMVGWRCSSKSGIVTMLLVLHFRFHLLLCSVHTARYISPYYARFRSTSSEFWFYHVDFLFDYRVFSITILINHVSETRGGSEKSDEYLLLRTLPSIQVHRPKHKHRVAESRRSRPGRQGGADTNPTRLISITNIQLNRHLNLLSYSCFFYRHDNPLLPERITCKPARRTKSSWSAHQSIQKINWRV